MKEDIIKSAITIAAIVGALAGLVFGICTDIVYVKVLFVILNTLVGGTIGAGTVIIIYLLVCGILSLLKRIKGLF